MNCELGKKQLILLQDAFDLMDIIFMTIDDFHQIMSSNPQLYEIFFPNCNVVRGIVDKVHLIEASTLTAAVDLVDEIVVFITSCG